jgi:hypothetical protein
MNYYPYKLKNVFYKLIFKIGFVKKWYIGNEMLKNPPTVIPNDGHDVVNMTFINVCLNAKYNNKISNNIFKNTLKLGRYF